MLHLMLNIKLKSFSNLKVCTNLFMILAMERPPKKKANEKNIAHSMFKFN